jgi:hypothetical protein
LKTFHLHIGKRTDAFDAESSLKEQADIIEKALEPGRAGHSCDCVEPDFR